MSGLVTEFERVGQELRVLATLDSLNYTIDYVRGDVADEYSDVELDSAYRTVMSAQVSSDDFGRETGSGPVDSQILVFEEFVVFLFPSARYDGVLVSYDRGDSFPFSDVLDVADDLFESPPVTRGR